MNITYFQGFEKLILEGRRQSALQALNQFIDSFADVYEMEIWTKSYLENFDGSRVRIPAELYLGVIGPALHSSCVKNEAWGSFWCLKTCEHLSILRQQMWQAIGATAHRAYVPP